MDEYISRAGIIAEYDRQHQGPPGGARKIMETFPAADVRPVAEIEKIIESLQEQADMYNQRAKELLVQEDGEISQYTWAVSLRETYRRIIKTLDDLIS